VTQVPGARDFGHRDFGLAKSDCKDFTAGERDINEQRSFTSHCMSWPVESDMPSIPLSVYTYGS